MTKKQALIRIAEFTGVQDPDAINEIALAVSRRLNASELTLATLPDDSLKRMAKQEWRIIRTARRITRGEK